MTLAIWRYAHMTLALVSGLFLVLAALTGAILAFEPIQTAVKPYQPVALGSVTLAETMTVLAGEYDEVLTLTLDADGFVLADVVTKEGTSETVYVNPRSGATLGRPSPQHPVFQFTTNLHRSLFLKKIGRFTVGLVSFLLCLLAVTGLLLLVKRQGGWVKLFSKVQKDYFELRYHVVFGRWLLLPIIVVAATGVYLSAEKFGLIPPTRIVHEVALSDADFDPIDAAQLPIFKTTTWDEVRSLAYPFSEFPEDYFELALRGKEMAIHQYTGEILSEQPYPFAFLANRWSLVLHTGQGSIAWSLVLFLVSLGILFFVYSGYVMWRKRIRNTKTARVPVDPDACTHIILVGSETGTTYGFAQALEAALTQAGKSVLVAEINAYRTYKNAEQLLFLTATYGEGEAPTNARNIETLLGEIRQERPMAYSVVAFGSLTYPSYCQFGVDLEGWLAQQAELHPTLAVYKINNQSHEAFQDWANAWGQQTGTVLDLPSLKKKRKLVKPRDFEVLERSALNVDDTYLLRLQPGRKIKFRSGDLWEIVPEDGQPRWYSIAKYQDSVLLSIKKHEFGTCSNQLFALEAGQTVRGGIKRNYNFHVPDFAPAVVCIANGTGIAPFLGVLDENTKGIPIDLYWGGRTQASAMLYRPFLDEAQSQNRLRRYHQALSQEGDGLYVQEVLERNAKEIASQLEAGAVFMICGSLAMQNAVLEVLGNISQKHLGKPLSDFEHQEQLKMDCY